ncbi:MAG TPA: type II toxin-antitoxin system HicB family antitoxin [Candidatus Magasanikbacteria bacterium]|nr:type II toxin-antitoxin system HicB family antitoxin [Candidatus Magasanikbacteria bacterium]
MRKIDLKSVVWKEGNYYISQCLEVDVSSYGKTKKEALSMLQDALLLYFEDSPIPKKVEVKRPSIVSVTLQCA